jgi:hypothetical protein
MHYNLPTDHVFVRIRNDGELKLNVPFITTVYCQMLVHDFPFDTQNCSWMDISMHYTTRELHMISTDIAIVPNGVMNPGMTLKLLSCSATIAHGSTQSGICAHFKRTFKA